MVITKDNLPDIVDQLPDSIDQALKESNEGLGQDWDEFKNEWLSEELLLLRKVEKSRRQVQEGKFLTEEEIDKEVDSWQ